MQPSHLFGQQFTKKIIVNEQVTFTPTQIENKIIDNVSVTITPIDTRSLNKETFFAARREGVYKSNTIESYQVQFSNSNDPYVIMVLDAFEKIDKLIQKGKILLPSLEQVSMDFEDIGLFMG